MRTHGMVERALGFGSSDHLCWAYGARAELAGLAADWLGDGARLGQRLVYVAEGPRDRLLDDLAGFEGRDRLIGDGALVVHTLTDLYDLSRPIDGEAQLATYAGVVRRAIADGFLGIRVLADVTALVADPARRAAHLRWEHQADRWMTEHPLAALCAYDEGALGDAVAPVACLHPLRHVAAELAPFGLWNGDDGRIVLDGEADAFCAGTLTDALAVLPEHADLVVDASNLVFVDGRAAAAVAAAAARLAEKGGSLRLRGAGRALCSVWTALELDPSVLAA